MTAVADQLLTRAKLSAPYRVRRAYGGQLAGAYAHARNALPQGVLLDAAPDVQAEIDRVCALYRAPRRIVSVQVPWATYQLGQVVRLQYPRYGLDDINALVIGRQRDVSRRVIRLTLWC